VQHHLKAVLLSLLVVAPSVGRGDDQRLNPCVGGIVCKTFTAPVLQDPVPTLSLPAANGQVVLELVVGSTGRVQSAQVLRGIHPEADKRATAAAVKWRYTPGTCDGKRVAMYRTVTITFAPVSKGGA
jgi:TonB family protein